MILLMYVSNNGAHIKGSFGVKYEKICTHVIKTI